jgi:hypothetical protein
VPGEREAAAGGDIKRRFGAILPGTWPGPIPILLNGLGAVFAANRQLFGGLDAHLDASSGPAQQCDLNGSVGE